MNNSLIIQNKQVELLNPHPNSKELFNVGYYFLIKENKYQYCITKLNPNQNHLLSKFGMTTNSYIWLNKNRFN